MAYRHPARSGRTGRDRLRYAPPSHFPDNGVFQVIQPTHVFKDNLAQLPAIDGIERIDLVDAKGAVVASI